LCGKGGQACEDCSAPGATCKGGCYDISAVFKKTDHEHKSYPPKIFGRRAVDGEAVYAALEERTDSSYTTYVHDCGTFYTGVKKALTWHIERELVEQGKVLVRVRGHSMDDCDKKRAVNIGEIQINKNRGWEISKLIRCYVSPDDNEQSDSINTYCKVDQESGNVSWRAGSLCKNCCACPEGAKVDIAFEVSKQDDAS
jgi:hypothetical protein